MVHIWISTLFSVILSNIPSIHCPLFSLESSRKSCLGVFCIYLYFLRCLEWHLITHDMRYQVRGKDDWQGFILPEQNIQHPSIRTLVHLEAFWLASQTFWYQDSDTTDREERNNSMSINAQFVNDCHFLNLYSVLGTVLSTLCTLTNFISETILGGRTVNLRNEETETWIGQVNCLGIGARMKSASFWPQSLVFSCCILLTQRDLLNYFT